MGATIKLFLSWMVPIFTFGGVAARLYRQEGAYFIRSANSGEAEFFRRDFLRRLPRKKVKRA
jgi:hypothetical protein